MKNKRIIIFERVKIRAHHPQEYSIITSTCLQLVQYLGHRFFLTPQVTENISPLAEFLQNQDHVDPRGFTSDGDDPIHLLLSLCETSPSCSFRSLSLTTRTPFLHLPPISYNKQIQGYDHNIFGTRRKDKWFELLFFFPFTT